MQLKHGDCLELLQTIPDKSVDMILCDLPYGTTACKWDVVIPFEPLWAQYKRIVKDNAAIVLTASQPFTSSLVLSNPEWFKYDMVWDKVSPTGHLNAKHRPLRQHEDILVFSNGTPPYFPIMRKSRLRWKGNNGNKGDGSNCYGASKEYKVYNDTYYPTSIIAESNAEKLYKQHPTQKPVSLLAYLIRTYTNPGDIILDNCMGSGSTGVACVNTGRNFIGMELDERYFQIAKDRIEQEAKQITLSDLSK